MVKQKELRCCSKRADVDTRDQNGRTTPLMYAAVGGRAEDHTHATAAQLLCDLVVGNSLADHGVGTRRLSSSNQLRMRLIGVLFGCGVQFPDLLNE